MKRILVVGYFGFMDNQIDGQTIKTRSIYSLICKHDEGNDVLYFDTQLFQKSLLNLLSLLLLLFRSNIVVYMPGKRNLKYVSPFIFFLRKVVGYRIIYPVVGGWLADYLEKNVKLKNRLRNVRAILVESNALKSRLENIYGFFNVVNFPNFRLIDYYPTISKHTEVRLVFMARIAEEKGVDLIFDYAEYSLNRKSLRPISISFYGPISSDYREVFENKLSACRIASYGGVIPPDDVYPILNRHDILLLPTFYEGEGFPGSIIDAYISGIPVIVSKWKDLPEFVDEGLSGYTFNLDCKNEFYAAIDKLIDNDELLDMMKNYSFHKSKEYSSEVAWSVLQEYLK